MSSNNSTPPLPDVSNVPLYIDNINIHGNNRTKTRFILSELADAKTKSSTVEEVNNNLMSSLGNLSEYGIFKNVNYTIDLSEKYEHCNVNVIVDEKQPFSIGTEVKQDLHTGEQTVEFKATVRNLFGEAEKFQLATSYGTQQSNAFNLTFTKPKLFKLAQKSFQGGFNLFSQMQHFTSFNSFTEKQRGLNTFIMDLNGNNELQYEYSFRDIIPTDKKLTVEEKALNNYRGPSSFVLHNAISSVKSSLKYQYTNSTLNNRLVPTNGRYFQFLSELAGLGGDVNFVKFQTDQKYYYKFNDWLSFGFGAIVAFIRPFSSRFNNNPNTQNQLLLNDKLYAGQPLTLRGFENGSLGPLIHYDPVGGDTSVTTAVSAIFKLPVFESFNQTGGRGQVFLNAGNILNVTSNNNNNNTINNNFQSHFSELIRTSRLSIGFGLSIPSPIGRMEFNLQHPIRVQPTDRTRGFQFGIGIQYC